MVNVSTPTKWTLRLLAIGYVFFLVAWPVALVVQQTFANGLDTLVDDLTIERVPDAGHFLPWEKPGALAGPLRSFLETRMGS